MNRFKVDGVVKSRLSGLFVLSRDQRGSSPAWRLQASLRFERFSQAKRSNILNERSDPTVSTFLTSAAIERFERLERA
jgi:hypothetical protein